MILFEEHIQEKNRKIKEISLENNIIFDGIPPIKELSFHLSIDYKVVEFINISKGQVMTFFIFQKRKEEIYGNQKQEKSRHPLYCGIGWDHCHRILYRIFHFDGYEGQSLYRRLCEDRPA